MIIGGKDARKLRLDDFPREHLSAKGVTIGRQHHLPRQHAGNQLHLLLRPARKGLLAIVSAHGSREEGLLAPSGPITVFDRKRDRQLVEAKLTLQLAETILLLFR